MPAETNARREIVPRVGEGLAIITESQVKREIAAHVKTVLHEHGVEPLRQVVAADAEVDWLRIALHVSKRQLSKWCGGAVSESERAEDRCARLAAGSTRAVMDDAAAETQVVFAERPREGVRELHLVTPQIGSARLSNRERRGAGSARVSRRKRLRFPERHRIAVQVSESRFIKNVRIDDRSVIDLRGPRSS